MRSISYVMVSFGYWNLYRKFTHERLILSPKILSLTSDHHCVTKREVIACNKLFACKSNIWKGGAGHWHLFGADLPHRSYGMCICRREVEGDLGVFFPLFPPCLLSSLRYSFLFSTFQIKWIWNTYGSLTKNILVQQTECKLNQDPEPWCNMLLSQPYLYFFRVWKQLLSRNWNLISAFFFELIGFNFLHNLYFEGFDR